MKKVLLLVLLITLMYGCSGDVDLGNPRFNASVDIPKGVDTSSVSVLVGNKMIALSKDAKFSISDSRLLFATTKDNKILYVGAPGQGDLVKFKLDSRETALYFALKEMPGILTSSNFEVLKNLKDVLYQNFPSIEVLEKAIEKNVARVGYLEKDSVLTEIQTVSDEIIAAFDLYNYKFKGSEVVEQRGKLGFCEYIGNYLAMRCVDDCSASTKRIGSDYEVRRNIFCNTQISYGVQVGWVNPSDGKAYSNPLKELEGFTPNFSLTDYYQRFLAKTFMDIVNIKEYFDYIQGDPFYDEFLANSTQFNLTVNTTDKNAVIFYAPKDDDRVIVYNLYSMFLPELLSNFSPTLANKLKLITEVVSSPEFKTYKTLVNAKKYKEAAEIILPVMNDAAFKVNIDYLTDELVEAIAKLTGVDEYFKAAKQFEVYYSGLQFAFNKSDYYKVEEDKNNAPVFKYNDFYPAYNGQYKANGTVSVKWNAEDPEGDDITYTIYAGEKIADLKQVKKDIKDKSATLSLGNSIKIYWKVVATDAFGHKTESTVYNFYRTNSDFLHQLFNKFEKLGFEVNYGENPTTINGTFIMKPNLLFASNLSYDKDSINKQIFSPIKIQIKSGNGNIDLFRSRQSEDYSSFDKYIIIGINNKFTVYTTGTYDFIPRGSSKYYTAVVEYIYSGALQNGNIINLTQAFYMVNNGGAPNTVENGAIRLFKDEDGVSEQTTWLLDNDLQVRDKNMEYVSKNDFYIQ